jgi:hypothetical protein
MDSINSLANRCEETGGSKKAEGFLTLRVLDFVIDTYLIALVEQAFALSARNTSKGHIEVNS